MMPPEHKAKLIKASKLLADLQKDMTTRHDRGSEEYLHTWQDIYWLREKLGELIRYGFVVYREERPLVPSA